MTRCELTDWSGESRELRLCCDEAGIVLDADAVARRILGEGLVGQSFSTVCAPGTEAKWVELLQAAARPGLQRDWELPLIVSGRPLTVSFHARRGADGEIQLLGSIIPPHFAQALTDSQDSMNEVAELSRQLVRQKRELERTNRALDDSNRGILALHRELEEKADALQRTADIRARLVANVSHEFRTPLHSILGISRLLLDAADGPINEEQRRQLQFIRTSAEELSAFVNDMLDLSRAEAGKVMLRIERTTAPEVLAALRGVMRPTVAEDSKVQLVFDDAPDVPLETDIGKVQQILRNLVSNALKFTEEGEVRVSAAPSGEGRLRFIVRDTGIGISAEDQKHVFREFGQVQSALQAKVKGTGLGLALSRKLAIALGGSLKVESAPGKGSAFTLEVPVAHQEAQEYREIAEKPIAPDRPTVLVVEDDRQTIFVYDRYLASAGFQVVPARSVADARKLLETVRPTAILLDVMLEGETTWTFLSELKADARTRDIPVLVVTVYNRERKARALGADEFWLKPISADQLLRTLHRLTRPLDSGSVLVIDDDEASRYIIRKLLEGTKYEIQEAADAEAGIAAARAGNPTVILLDFFLPEHDAFYVIDALKADPSTRSIPIIVVTAHALGPEERQRLATVAESVVSKEELTRELAINRIRDALQRWGRVEQSAPEPVRGR